MKHIKIITHLEIDPGSVDDAELLGRIRRAAECAFADGHYTGDSDAAIERWDVDVLEEPVAAVDVAANGAAQELAAGSALEELAAAVAETRARRAHSTQTLDADLGAIQATIEHLCLQIEQMRGMFDDSDGNIRDSLQDAEDASEILGRLRSAARLQRSEGGDAVPDVVVRMTEDGPQIESSHPVKVTWLEADLRDDWEYGETALVDGERHEWHTFEIDATPAAVAATLRQVESAELIADTLADALDDDLQAELDELVIDSVIGRFCVVHGTLTEALAAEAEAEASTINNAGIGAQVCEILAHGDPNKLDALIARPDAGPTLGG